MPPWLNHLLGVGLPVYSYHPHGLSAREIFFVPRPQNIYVLMQKLPEFRQLQEIIWVGN